MPEGFVVIYIIEDQEGRSFTTNEIRIVNNAIASIQINDGICVQRTQNANATLNYLQLLHETIRQKYTVCIIHREHPNICIIDLQCYFRAIFRDNYTGSRMNLVITYQNKN